MLEKWKIHLKVSEGYLKLGMIEDAANELEEMPAEDRARPEVIGF